MNTRDAEQRRMVTLNPSLLARMCGTSSPRSCTSVEVAALSGLSHASNTVLRVRQHTTENPHARQLPLRHSPTSASTSAKRLKGCLSSEVS